MTRAFQLAVAAAAGLTAPGLAAAQSQWCLDFVANYCGPQAVNDCFIPEFIPEEVPAECIGDVQMLYEMANEADQQFYQDQAESSASGGFDVGYSYGGNLREGPGDEYAIVGSLPEGAYVNMQMSGTWSGGYQWFWVETDYGSAYHWGGLICSLDTNVDGVLSGC